MCAGRKNDTSIVGGPTDHLGRQRFHCTKMVVAVAVVVLVVHTARSWAGTNKNYKWSRGNVHCFLRHHHSDQTTWTTQRTGVMTVLRAALTVGTL